MSEVNINQFQDYFLIDKNLGIKIDYLKGKYELINSKEEDIIKEIISEDYNNIDLKYYENKDKLKPTEMTVVIIPSYRCNMECEYCYEGSIKMTTPEVNDSRIGSIISSIKELINKNNYKKVNFILLGGEPIMREHINWYIKFFNLFENESLEYRISCVSNGLELSDNIDSIKKLGIEYFQLTLDGLEDIHNSRKKSKNKSLNPFKQVCKSIDILLSNNIKTSLRINVDDNNVDEIGRIIDLIIEKRWNENKEFIAYIYPISHSGNDKTKKYSSETIILKKVLDVLSKLPKEKRILDLDFHGVDFVEGLLRKDTFIPTFSFCSSCRNQYVFDSKGNIYTCWWGSGKKDFIVGKYDENKYNFDNNKLKEWHSHDVNNIDKCKGCKYKYICGAGCVYKSIEKSGCLKSGNCADFKQLIYRYIRYKFEVGDI